MSETNEPVIREPKALSDFYCSPCEKRGKVGVMRYKGTKRGRTTATYEDFDEDGESRLYDRTVGITVYVWVCDNCGRRDEDTLGY